MSSLVSRNFTNKPTPPFYKITCRISFRAPDRTLTKKEVDKEMKKLARKLIEMGCYLPDYE